MKLGILEVGKVPADLQNQYAPYPQMFEDLLRPHTPDLSVTVYDLLDRDPVPTDPTLEDGWLITGSPRGAYDDDPWIAPLEDFIRAAHTLQKPLVGICFGHQIIAQALGGVVQKSDKGWGAGLHSYTVTPDFADDGTTIQINAMHQDQVIETPADATVWASSDFCPHAGLLIGDHIFTLQPHPEFDPAYEAALINARYDTLIPKAVADPALASLAGLETVTDATRVAAWMARTLFHKI